MSGGSSGKLLEVVMQPSASDRREKERLRAELAASGFSLPGTFLERWMSCKKPGCRCSADPPQLHGPYYQWTRRVSGKTETRLLTEEQASKYREWFDNAKRDRTIIAKLEELSLAIVESAEGWRKPTQKTTRRRRKV